MSVVERAPRRGTLWTGPTVVQVRPLANDVECAFLIVRGSHDGSYSLPGSAVIDQWLATLLSWGYLRVRTSALSANAANVLAGAGFSAVQDLNLLSLSHWTPPKFSISPDHQAKKAARFGRGVSLGITTEILNLDCKAFGPKWALDGDSFKDALDATSRSQVFTVRNNKKLLGFAIVGAGNATGYLQRLAVDQESRDCGIGHCLVAASIQWASRMGCSQTVVNTEANNQPALHLYEKMGFVCLPNRLTVLHKELR